VGNKCPQSWPLGFGSQCLLGHCAPSFCNSLCDFDWALGGCKDVSSDPQNWQVVDGLPLFEVYARD